MNHYYFLSVAFNVSVFFFFFKQKTAYEMRISDWSSDVCSSDLDAHRQVQEEGVVPAYILRQPSTDQRAEHRPKNGGDAEQRVADRLLRTGEARGDDGHRRGDQRAAGKALSDAEIGRA